MALPRTRRSFVNRLAGPVGVSRKTDLPYWCPQSRCPRPCPRPGWKWNLTATLRLLGGSGDLFEHKLGVEGLPDVLTLALSSPAESVLDVLAGEGLGDIDLAAVACLCVPLSAIPAADRSAVTALCQHP